MPARLAAVDPRYQPSRPRPNWNVGRRFSAGRIYGLIAVMGLGSLALWFLVTFAPIIRVEAQYQWKKTLLSVFGTTSVRGIFLPNLSLDLRGATAVNTQDGIVIPSLFVDAPVIYNVDPNDSAAYTVALRKGIAHASGTAFPGEGGLGYYFAHSSAPEFRSQYNAVFYLLGKMQAGDEVFVWHEGQRAEYRVTEIRTVPPTDVSFLTEQRANETIVMQTCWPPGTTQLRRLVFAERVTDN